ETLVGTQPLLPKMKFTAVPYALRAGNSGWSLTGNSGTDPATNFIGTTDYQPFDLRAGNIRGLRLESTLRTDVMIVGSMNLIGGYSCNAITEGVIGGTICGGGLRNTIPLYGTTYFPNKVTDDFGTVCGGVSNQAGDDAGTVSDKTYATVGGGRENTSSGSFSTIPGGYQNEAAGDYSFAAGRRAKALYNGSFVWGDSTDEDISASNINQFIIRASGGVGIGTNAPTHALTVKSSNFNTLRLLGPTGTTNYSGKINFGDGDYVYIQEDADNKLRINATRVALISDNVGIGTINPYKKLQVDNGDILVRGTGNYAMAGNEACVFLGDTNNYIKAVNNSGLRFGTSSGADILTISNNNVGIGTTTPGTRLDVRAPSGSYAASFTGNVRIVSQISGNTVLELGEGLDYAEGFNVSDDDIVPGTVLIIDPDNPGKLAISKKAYDTKVAGIVAGANQLGSGVRLGAGQFDHDVALAGRVYCNVDATTAGIEPGDLLTTSDVPGYAMKASDHTRAAGAILGKAMQRLEKGQKGQILVLVTLQ
ncbi:MAG TPA: hypothetical protein PLP86_08040, partial [Armatimonadota bacterium]|nr:hypothetical protein [Armatimonadota bacterium]